MPVSDDTKDVCIPRKFPARGYVIYLRHKPRVTSQPLYFNVVIENYRARWRLFSKLADLISMAAVILCKGYDNLLGELWSKQKAVQMFQVICSEKHGPSRKQCWQACGFEKPPQRCWEAGQLPPLSAGKMTAGVQGSLVYFTSPWGHIMLLPSSGWCSSQRGLIVVKRWLNDVQCILFNEAEQTGIYFITVSMKRMKLCKSFMLKNSKPQFPRKPRKPTFFLTRQIGK